MASAAGVSRVLSTQFGAGVFSTQGHPKWGEPVFVGGRPEALKKAQAYLSARGYEVTASDTRNQLAVSGNPKGRR